MHVLDHLDTIKTIMILLPILMLGLVPMVNGYTAADMTSFNVGFKAGHDDGLNAVYDIGGTCDNYNIAQCTTGYVMGSQR
jgi:hypothetical protein